MESIRHQVERLAQNLQQSASSAGTRELFGACLGMVIEMGIALNCNFSRNTGAPGNGILFEDRRQEPSGQLTFYATGRGFANGVVALAISNTLIGKRVPQFEAMLETIQSRNLSVSVPQDPQHRWSRVGFATISSGKQIIQEVANFLLGQTHWSQVEGEPTADPSVLRSIKERRGQPEFRQKLLAAYKGRCAITDCDVVDALEAAHIVPHSMGGRYDTSNGLLLRADIHTLFDLHLLTVCPDLGVVQLNRRLMSAYGQFEGKALQVPIDKADMPDRQGLVNHRNIWRSIF
jgi:hypothetical protein